MKPWLRLLLLLLTGSVVSLALGLGASWLAGRLRCSGELPSCNIQEAVGAYAVLIWAVLGPAIFGVTIAIARNRTALLGAMLVLLAPLATFYVLATHERVMSEQAQFGVELRTFLVMIAPPTLAVLLQWLTLRLGLFLRAQSQA